MFDGASRSGASNSETIQLEIAIALSRQADAVEYRNELLTKLNADARGYYEKMGATARIIKEEAQKHNEREHGDM